MKTGLRTESIVAVVGCYHYESQTVLNAVQQGIELLGGIGRFVRPGEHILLKPNVLEAAVQQRCVTTNPTVLEAVIRVCKAEKAHLSCGDSPGITAPEAALKSSGLMDVINRYGVAIGDFSTATTVSFPEGTIRKNFPIAAGALKADGIISLSKMKTHGFTRFTGAVKNQFGCIPGVAKAAYHAQFAMVQDFCLFLVDITRFLKPRLYIMDAVMAMEGNGPANGKPKKIGCLLFSTDPVALDAVACRIIGLNPYYVPTARAGQASGLGTAQSDRIRVVGDPLDRFYDSSFDVIRKPALSIRGERIIPSFLKNLFLPHPVLHDDRCIRCGKCSVICPPEPKALLWEKGQRSLPVYRRSACIRCFCCQEICPAEAITIYTPPSIIFLHGLSLGIYILRAIVTVVKRVVSLILKRKGGQRSSVCNPGQHLL